MTAIPDLDPYAVLTAYRQELKVPADQSADVDQTARVRCLSERGFVPLAALARRLGMEALDLWKWLYWKGIRDLEFEMTGQTIPSCAVRMRRRGEPWATVAEIVVLLVALLWAVLS